MLLLAVIGIAAGRAPAAESDQKTADGAAVDAIRAPAIAAAADLRFAMDELLDAYRKAGGGELRLSFGSSGNFARQIAAGAPFEMFLSADEDFVLRLADAGLTRDRGTLYAIGRLVLFAPAGSALEPDEGLDGLGAFLEANPAAKLAIANPEHAPYGRAAEQALRTRGLWDAVQPHLVLGENVAQAAQFAVSGGAAGGIFAHSLTFAPEFGGRGRFALIPAELHQPLRQRMVLLKTAGAGAERFYRFLQQAEARAILQRFGFESIGP